MVPHISLAACRQAFAKWNDDNCSRLGAALAYYTLLSLAPLLLFVVAMIAFVFGKREAQTWILHEASQLIGAQGTETVRTLLRHAPHGGSGIVASVVGVITLLFGASGVFSELRDGLNIVWSGAPEQSSTWIAYLKNRLFSFGMVLAIGFLLLVSLVLSTVIATIGAYFGGLMPIPAWLLEVVNFLFSIYVIAFLFALIFKYVPRAAIDWRDVWNGSLFTALLFTGGKQLLGLYLGMASVGSAYGAAGSLVAVVVWVYYSAQIFYYGAEYTWVDAKFLKSLPGAAARASPPAANLPRGGQANAPAAHLQ